MDQDCTSTRQQENKNSGAFFFFSQQNIQYGGRCIRDLIIPYHQVRVLLRTTVTLITEIVDPSSYLEATVEGVLIIFQYDHI
jgi:hypothetical protein